VVPEEKSTSQKLATDAMFKLEHGEKDVSKSKAAAPIIDRLHDHRERWRDDYAANRLLRDQFRVRNKFIYLYFLPQLSFEVLQLWCIRFFFPKFIYRVLAPNFSIPTVEFYTNKFYHTDWGTEKSSIKSRNKLFLESEKTQKF